MLWLSLAAGLSRLTVESWQVSLGTVLIGSEPQSCSNVITAAGFLVSSFMLGGGRGVHVYVFSWTSGSSLESCKSASLAPVDLSKSCKKECYLPHSRVE